MNRFVKKNFALVSILALAALIACGLLVYATIVNFQRAGYNGETNKLVAQIAGLIKKKPAPVDGNRPLLEQDIALYSRISVRLRERFQNPLLVAVDEFLSVLEQRPVKDEEGKLKPVEPMTRVRFLEMFRPEWDAIPAGNFPQQEYFLRQFRRRFKNWEAAQAKFIEKAKEITLEPLDTVNADAVLLSALGIPRMLRGSPDELKRFMENMRVKISEISADKLSIPFEASQFGFNFASPGNYLPADYPIIIAHWNHLGDLVKRLVNANVKMLYGIKVRVRGAEGNTPSLQGSVEQSGSYKLYHYSIEISGSMASIRRAAKLLDDAYQDGRVYIVRSIFLFAEENGAHDMFVQASVDENESAKAVVSGVSDPRPVVRGRGRGRGRGGLDPAEAPMEIRQNSDDQKRREEERKCEERRREQEKKLPAHERSGYGNVLIGSVQEYRAIIDVDYVVLNQ